MNTNAKTESINYPYYVSHRAPLFFLFFSILCQIIGVGILTLLRDLLGQPYLLLLCHSLIAFFLSRWLKLPIAWQIFNLLLAPGVVLYMTLGLPSGIIFLALILSVLLYLPTFWTRVPYYPTSKKMYALLAQELPTDKSFRFIDLGCGFGTLLTYLLKTHPKGDFEGVEISPLAYLFAKLRFALHKNPKPKIYFKNFWTMDLGNYDVVYAFLSPPPMPYLWEKLQAEMKPGNIFITNTFPVPEKATKEIKVDDSHQGVLYVHRK